MLESIAISFWILVGGVLFVIAVAVVAFLVWANEQSQAAPIETGVRIWEGSPGSGKSYMVVAESLRRIELEHRPLYTNLPLRLRTIRAYLRLRGVQGVERYAIRLTKAHFVAFVDRFAELADYADRRELEGIPRSKALTEFQAVAGPDVPYPASRAEWVRYRALGTDGELAEDARRRAEFEFEDLPKKDGRLLPNWIPYGSMIAIDEVHRWFSQANQKDESPALLSYLSMHRHGLYFIDLISQNAMQMSISFRRQCVKYFLCVDKRQLGFIWGTFVRLPTFCYQEVSAEAAKADASGRFKEQPLRTWLAFPWLSGGIIWRFYQSHTHCGSQRRLKEQLERTRQFVEQEDYEPDFERKRSDVIRKRTSAVWSVVRAGGFVILCLVCCWWITSAMYNGGAADVAAQVSDGARSQETTRAGERERMLLERREVQVTGVCRIGALIDGSLVPVGGAFGDIQVVGLRGTPAGIAYRRDGDERVRVVGVPGRLWVGRPGMADRMAERPATQPSSESGSRR